MKCEFDKKSKEICYVPENDWDVYQLGKISANMGWGSVLFGAEGKMKYISFGAVSLIKYLGENATRAKANQNKP